MIQVNTGAVVQTAISTHSYNDTLMAPLICSEKRSERWYGFWHTLTQACKDTHSAQTLLNVSYLMMHTTHTLYRHTTSHANTCIVLIKVGYHMCLQVRLEQGVWCWCNLLAVEVISKQLSVFWLISGQNRSALLERGMWEAFMRETWLLYHHNRVPDG